MEPKMTSRRSFLSTAASAAALAALPRGLRAEDYPSRPVRIIEGAGPGGAPDLVARLIGSALSERLGQPFIVENRTGAGGNIATEFVVRAPADGYTLLLVFATHAINATLYEKLNFDFLRDIAPVAPLMSVPLVLEVNPSVPAGSVPELIAYAKANPGKINMASGGIGTPQHVAGEMFNMMAGTKMLHVPYRGALAFPDLLAGQVQVMFGILPSSIEYIRTGKLRALAVSTRTPLTVLPELPPIASYLPGYEATAWNGIGAPAATPPEIIDTLSRAINASLAEPSIRKGFADIGGQVLASSPTAFGRFIEGEVEKWAEVIRAAQIKAQ
jgi:tripartite-type tricarboxylate transporter receptor subunit TctC